MNPLNASYRHLLVGGLWLLLLSGCGDAADHADHAAEPQAHQDHQDHDHQVAQVQDPHEDHAPENGIVRIAGEVARGLGITLAEARREDLDRVLRAPGEVVADETRLSTVSLRFGGWAEFLHVDQTGQLVRAGEPMMEVYSPELVSAQEDFLSARELAQHLAHTRVAGTRERSDALVEAARDRLRYWQVPEAEIRRLEETGEVRSRITLEAPFSGYVAEMGIRAGERFQSGTPLYRLVDLSRVWIYLEVYERDLPHVREGSQVEVEVPAHPDRAVQGTVTRIYPQVDRDRRTARARVEVANPGTHLKPGMFGTARTRVQVARDAVTVPRDAVMHTGERALVFVAVGDDRYQAREVEVGAHSGDRVEIVSGLQAGEQVVARAGFILDSESRLMEAMMRQPGMPGMDMDADHGAHDDHEDPVGHDDHNDHQTHDDHGGHHD